MRPRTRRLAATAGATSAALLIALAAMSCSLLVDTDGLALPGSGSGNAFSVSDDGGDARAASGDARAADAAGGCAGFMPESSLLAYYRFDEGSGTTVHDCSGHGLDGTVALGGGGWTTGHTARAIHFDGAATCIDLGTPAMLDLRGPFTLAAWTKVEDFDGTNAVARFIVGKTTDPLKLGWRLGTDSPPQFEMKIGNGTGAVETQATGIPANVWKHVAATFVAGQHGRVFVDGALAVDVANQPDPIVTDASAHVRIGCRYGASFFKGVIDELRIYDRVLDDAEIAALAK